MKIALIQYSSKFDGSTISGSMIARRLTQQGHQVKTYFGTEGPFADKLKGENLDCEVIRHHNWLRSPGLRWFVRNLILEREPTKKFREAFKSNRPDVVYSNTLVSYAAVRAARALRIPTVWHVRELFSDVGGELHWPIPPMRAWMRRWISNMGSSLVVNSSSVGENVFGAPPVKPYTVIPNAVSEDFFKPRKSREDARAAFDFPADVPLVGLPGTFRPVKGQDFLLSSIPKVLETIPNCHFAMTGGIDTEFAQQIQRQVKERNLEPNVHFTGSITNMVDFYHACDLCCVPSKSEPFGRTAIECLASETPLVVSQVGGLAEIVQSGSNGLVVEFGDEAALSQAIIELISNAELRVRLASQGKRDAVAHYNEANYGSRVLKVVEALA